MSSANCTGCAPQVYVDVELNPVGAPKVVHQKMLEPLDSEQIVVHPAAPHTWIDITSINAAGGECEESNAECGQKTPCSATALVTMTSDEAGTYLKCTSAMAYNGKSADDLDHVVMPVPKPGIIDEDNPGYLSIDNLHGEELTPCGRFAVYEFELWHRGPDPQGPDARDGDVTKFRIVVGCTECCYEAQSTQ